MGRGTASSVPRTSRAWFRRHASSLPVVLTAGAIAVAGLALSLSTWIPSGVNDGRMVDAATVSATVFMAVGALGLGTWLGVSSTTSGLARLEYRRVSQRAMAPAARVGAAAAVCAAAVVLVWAANATAMILVPHRAGTVSPALAVYAVSAVAAMVPLGYTIGRTVPRLLTVPAVVVSGWFLASMLHGSRDFRMYWPRFWVEATVFDAWNEQTWIGAALWFVGIGIVATVAGTWSHVSRIATGVLVTGVAVSVIGAGAMALTEYRINDRSQDLAMDYQDVVSAHCEGSDPTLCLPGSFEGVRHELHNSLAVLASRLEGTPQALDRVELRPRGVGQAPAVGTVAVHMDRALFDEVPWAVEELVGSFAQGEQCFVPEGEGSWEYTVAIMQWLSSPHTDVEVSNAAESAPGVTSFTSWNEDDRRDWLGVHWEEFTQCTLTDADFG